MTSAEQTEALRPERDTMTMSGASNRPTSVRALRLLTAVFSWTVTIAAAAILIAIMAFMLAPRVLDLQGLIVLSGSMEPKLPLGGMVFIEKVDPKTLEAGDVITFGVNRVGTTHRIVEVLNQPDGLKFRTKGDANAEPDQDLVPAVNVRGQAKFILPYAGYAVDALRDRGNFYIFIGIPAVLLVLNELLNVAKELRKPAEGPISGSQSGSRKEASV